MGASSSSEGEGQESRRDRLEQLRENVQFEVEEETGTMRVYIGGGAATRTGESVQRSGSMSRDTEEDQREEAPNVVPGLQRHEEGEGEEDGAEGEGEGEERARLRFMLESDSDDTGDEDESRHSTLRLLARLFGARTGRLQHKSKCSGHKATDKEHVLPPPEPMHPSCDLYQEMVQYSRGVGCGPRNNICDKLNLRQLSQGGLSEGQKVNLTAHIMPRYPCVVDIFTARIFCGTYNREGTMFICAVQDNRIYLYDTHNKFDEYKTVLGRDVGWSILDVVFSPDQYWFAYSTWSPCINVCNVYGEEEKHYSLDLRPDMHDHFCAFSVQFSSDGSELIAACSDGYLYVYNREICDRTLKIDAHQDDGHAVAVDDRLPHIIYSAGDDGLCKVWDRRTLSESNPRPVGCLAGHKDGITFLDSRGDGRYLITNCKDQSIKLWDIRKFSKKEGIHATLSEVQRQMWDYRWQNVPRKARRDALVKLPGDSSVMTYTGHMVKHTLLRARFSPPSTTGQKYIYTASARGRVLVYDVLTGEVVQTLVNDKYNNCVRDVSWHPNQPAELVSSSWDGVLQLWTQNKRPNLVPERQSPLFS